jgi:DNA-binding transcriptional MerR regulator
MSRGINIGALAGQLPPVRPTQVERLSFIRHCRSMDMPLDEIRALPDFRDAPTRNCAEVSALNSATGTKLLTSHPRTPG